jgi:hypothetical protein
MAFMHTHVSSPGVFRKHVQSHQAAKFNFHNSVLILTALPLFLNNTCGQNISGFVLVFVSIFLPSFVFFSLLQSQPLHFFKVALQLIYFSDLVLILFVSTFFFYFRLSIELEFTFNLILLCFF